MSTAGVHAEPDPTPSPTARLKRRFISSRSVVMSRNGSNRTSAGMSVLLSISGGGRQDALPASSSITSYSASSTVSSGVSAPLADAACCWAAALR
jgi:hypothetical protein